MTTTGPASAADETILAVVAATAPSPGLAALRSGLLRIPGRGPLGSVCAALADGWGVPARLLRVLAVLLALLGPGLVLYTILYLLLPAVRPGPDAGPGSDAPGSSREAAPRMADVARGPHGWALVLVAVVLLPLAASAIAWMILLGVHAPGVLVLLILLSALLGALVIRSAVRARRARTAYLLGRIAASAGLLEPEALEHALEAHRARAPAAWAGAEALAALSSAGEAGPEGSAAAERAAGQGAPAEQGAASAAGPDAELEDEGDDRGAGPLGHGLRGAALLAAGALAYAAVSLRPGLLPWLTRDIALPWIGQVGAAAGAVAMVAGVLLLLSALGRSRARGTALAGLLALLLFAGATGWSRLTYSPDTHEVFVISEYVPGASYDLCATAGPKDWGKTVRLDLSQMTMPTDEEAMALWLASMGLESAPTEEQMMQGVPAPYIPMTFVCNRRFGDLEVVLPAGAQIAGGFQVVLGTTSGAVPPKVDILSTEQAGLYIFGQLDTGDLRYEEAMP